MGGRLALGLALSLAFCAARAPSWAAERSEHACCPSEKPEAGISACCPKAVVPQAPAPAVSPSAAPAVELAPSFSPLTPSRARVPEASLAPGAPARGPPLG